MCVSWESENALNVNACECPKLNESGNIEDSGKMSPCVYVVWLILLFHEFCFTDLVFCSDWHMCYESNKKSWRNLTSSIAQKILKHPNFFHLYSHWAVLLPLWRTHLPGKFENRSLSRLVWKPKMCLHLYQELKHSIFFNGCLVDSSGLLAHLHKH